MERGEEAWGVSRDIGISRGISGGASGYREAYRDIGRDIKGEEYREGGMSGYREGYRVAVTNLYWYHPLVTPTTFMKYS